LEEQLFVVSHESTLLRTREAMTMAVPLLSAQRVGKEFSQSGVRSLGRGHTLPKAGRDGSAAVRTALATACSSTRIASAVMPFLAITATMIGSDSVSL
jgi:hypothetical protein